MSTRASVAEFYDVERINCSICGTSDWRGMWMGDTNIFVCYRCATVVLPRLIADATWQRGGIHKAIGTLEKVQAEFWYATAVCESRKGR